MSDSNMPSRRGMVVGTAGHIDHGKTALVYALTGIDTDRLKEEKRRGISIDLGFAPMRFADGLTISFVDVPGHERFIRNMLAGAAGIEAVLLIVAANESVMPQTREHFEICKLLGLRWGLIVLTKCDLATPGQMAIARSDVELLAAGSFLAHAPVVEVSATTKAGIAELKERLADMMSHDTRRDSEGVVRMPVDRSFAAKGFGTVVTGTLVAGTVQVGDWLELLPQKLKVRVRGLQSLSSAVPQVYAGQRVAINLAGVEQSTIKRGHLLTGADALAASGELDVELHWLPDHALPAPRELFVLYIGTAEVSARIHVHRGANEARCFAQLRLTNPVIAIPGDRFVVRRPSPSLTVGGGVVMDAFPPRRANRSATVARLQELSCVLKASHLGRHIEMLVDEAPAGLRVSDLIRLTGASRAQVLAALATNQEILISTDERAVTRKWIEDKRHAVTAWLQDFHKQNPNAAGAPLAAARLGVDATLAALIFQNFDAVLIQGETVSLAGHESQLSVLELTALREIEQAFRVGGFQPPSAPEAMASAGIEGKKARALLESLVKNKTLIRLPDNLVFHSDVIGHIRTSLAQHKGRRFSIVEFKAWTNISRKFAIPLLEYFDQQHVTKRDGDARIVL